MAAGDKPPTRTSREAIEAAEYATWKPRLEDLDRAAEIQREADRRRDRLSLRFVELNTNLGGPSLPPELAPQQVRDAAAAAWEEISPESQAIAREWHATNEWEFRELRKVEEKRDEQARSGLLPFDDEAMAKFRALRAQLVSMAATLATPAAYKEFFVTRFAPEYNKLSSYDRYCVECGARFAITDGRARARTRDPEKCYCSDDCAARRRNRGRPRVSKADKIERAISRHLEACDACRKGRPCVRREAMLAQEQSIRARSRRLK